MTTTAWPLPEQFVPQQASDTETLYERFVLWRKNRRERRRLERIEEISYKLVLAQEVLARVDRTIGLFEREVSKRTIQSFTHIDGAKWLAAAEKALAEYVALKERMQRQWHDSVAALGITESQAGIYDWIFVGQYIGHRRKQLIADVGSFNLVQH